MSVSSRRSARLGLRAFVLAALLTAVMTMSAGAQEVSMSSFLKVEPDPEPINNAHYVGDNSIISFSTRKCGWALVGVGSDQLYFWRVGHARYGCHSILIV